MVDAGEVMHAGVCEAEGIVMSDGGEKTAAVTRENAVVLHTQERPGAAEDIEANLSNLHSVRRPDFRAWLLQNATVLTW